MAFGKSSRMDSRRSSSSYCSTVTLVAFVALCLVGVWMMTSSSIAPVEVSSIDNKPEVQQRVSQTEKQFEDTSGDVIDDTGKGDSEGGGTTSEEQTIDDSAGQNIEANEQETQEEPPAKETETKKEAVETVTDGQSFSDENGKAEGGETTKDGGEGEQSSRGDGNEDSKLSEQQLGVTNDEKMQGDDSGGEATQEEKVQEQTGQKGDELEGKDLVLTTSENKTKETVQKEVFPDAAQSELLNETTTQAGSWSTQATESKKEKESQTSSNGQNAGLVWKLCNNSAGADYIPCLDDEALIRKLPSTKHYEHRERHCPAENPTCLVALPDGYRQSISWPDSRDKIWYANVPHTKLAKVKGHQNWVKATGEFLTFPGGGTQFKHGALHYIDFIQKSLDAVAWGKQTRVILDVGCGVASFGGFLFDRDVLAMSFAPKDEHEAQVQFALERGIPAISAVMGTKRLPFPGIVFDAIHCARCRVPWHIEGGKLLLELNRLLRPGGYFIWSATPIYQKLPEDVEIWQAMSALTKSMCWEMVTMTKDDLNQVGIAIYKKPVTNDCYKKRVENSPPLCKESDDPNAAWNILLQDCMHKVPVDTSARGSQWPVQWPKRLETPPFWLNSSQVGVYGQAAPEDFKADNEHWKRVVSKSYVNGMGIDWSKVRNVMDMRAVYGGFAAAMRDMKVWVMNVVSIDSADTLPIIYERGLFGIYHDWCESFSTYPRSYDLLHADHLFSKVKKRCPLLSVVSEVDRILRPEGKLIVRDNIEMIAEMENIARSLKWEIRMTYSKDKEGLLCLQKSIWRPEEYDSSM